MKATGESLWRLAYPEQCVVCGGLLGLERRHFCSPCYDALPWIGPHSCPRCGEQTAPQASTDGGCAACRGRQFAFSRAVAPFRYEREVRDLILHFKLGRRASLGYVLGELLCGYLARDGVSRVVDLVVPVPLHWRRRMHRGFNQAELLALEIGMRFGLPVASRVVRRRRATVSQTAFSGLRRTMNVRDAFAARVAPRGTLGRLWAWARGIHGLLGRRVLLVDDILTTGSTVHECARALRGAGARDVLVATVARVSFVGQ